MWECIDTVQRYILMRFCSKEDRKNPSWTEELDPGPIFENPEGFFSLKILKSVGIEWCKYRIDVTLSEWIRLIFCFFDKYIILT